MDRDEAMRLLRGGKEGVAEWNRRRAAGETIPGLSGADLFRADLDEADLTGAVLTGAVLSRAALAWADLTGADLTGADLSRADLDGAVLTGADLSEADLTGAQFTSADLTGAVLTGAVLPRANLEEADLTGADLTGADLSRADLTAADLAGTHLIGASCDSTIFADVDLAEVQGLDTIRHGGPSHVSTSTLIRSRGKIPEAFLRGCGLPDVWIAYLPDLIGAMEPIQFYSCFISHSSRDKAFVDRLYSRMKRAKLSVWSAHKDMRGGRKSVDQIRREIRHHDKLLLVLSKASMASDWVKHEIAQAVAKQETGGPPVLFPIALVGPKAIKDWTAFDSDLGRDLAKEVREYHILDFTKCEADDAFEAAFARLLDDLKIEVRPARGETPGG